MSTLMATPPLYGPVSSSSGVSDEARVGPTAVWAVEAEEERSLSLFAPKAEAIAQLWALVKECDQEGWDGDDANPISEIAAHLASKLIRALPSNLAMPEAAPEPDGAISLDWIRSRNQIFSLSVGTGSRLPYAWVDGTDRGYGVARFDGVTVPRRVLDDIRKIMVHGETAVRSA